MPNDCLGLMTVEQMIMTRQRQITFEIEEAEENKSKLDAEYWALENWLLEKEFSGRKYESPYLSDLRNAIINNEPPGSE